MRIALISYDPQEDLSGNEFQKCKEILEFCSAQSADFCIFPETTFSGFNFPSSKSAEFYEDSPTIDFFKKEALRLEIAIMFGLFLKSYAHERVYNSALVVGKSGSEIARYNKLHLFSHAGENEYNTSGATIETAHVEDISFGLSICYDLRFPEMFVNMSKDCQALVNIANWPHIRESHWRSLMKARAIENQCFFIGVNRYGFDSNGLFFGGNSQIYNPSGNLVKPEFSSQAKVSLYSLDFDLVQETREKFFTGNDRRFISSLSSSRIDNKL